MKRNFILINFPLLIALILILFVYRNYFTGETISAGDLTYLSREMMKELISPPLAWETSIGNGFGGKSLFFQGPYVYNLPLGIMGNFIGYNIAERLLWFIPILLIGTVGAFKLSSEIAIFPRAYRMISILIVLLNSYFLMIISGGQITICLGYVSLIFAFYLWLKVMRNTDIVSVIKFAVSFSIVFSFDFRFLYLLNMLIFLHSSYIIFSDLKSLKQTLKKVITILIPTYIVFILIHSYWLVPFLLSLYNPAANAPTVYTASSGLSFFSSAEFSKSFSLLHPNYPENIFGKSSFMKPEYLILPILVYSSIFFIKRENKKIVIFLMLLGLFSSFMAKGVNLPFPLVYKFLFEHFPGFVMFRDPTKFYVFTVISYSILLPFTLYNLEKNLREKLQRKKIALYIRIFFTFVLLFLVRDIFSGNIKGTLNSKEVPTDYVEYKNYIIKENTFFRTFWIPSWQRFGYYSNQNPVVSADSFYLINDPVELVLKLKQKNTEQIFIESAIKYVVIPFDSEKEKFLTDRKYDKNKREELERELDKIEWLNNKKVFGGITIYETKNTKAHFWLNNNAGNVSYRYINPTKYLVKVNVKSNSNLIFSETFDPLWEFSGKNFKIVSNKFLENKNSFYLPIAGVYEGVIEFTPQRYVFLGVIISISAVTFLITIIILKKRVKKKI